MVQFVPFLQFDPEIRKVVCSTNAIESVNARIRRAVKARGHFPNETAALKCIYLAVMSLDPTGTGLRRARPTAWPFGDCTVKRLSLLSLPGLDVGTGGVVRQAGR